MKCIKWQHYKPEQVLQCQASAGPQEGAEGSSTQPQPYSGTAVLEADSTNSLVPDHKVKHFILLDLFKLHANYFQGLYLEKHYKNLIVTWFTNQRSEEKYHLIHIVLVGSFVN